MIHYDYDRIHGHHFIVKHDWHSYFEKCKDSGYQKRNMPEPTNFDHLAYIKFTDTHCGPSNCRVNLNWHENQYETKIDKLRRFVAVVVGPEFSRANRSFFTHGEVIIPAIRGAA